MNLVHTNLLREVAAEVKAQGGPIQFKAHALKNLELRTVLKESHGSPVLDIVFNTLGPDHRNLFASIGKDQVTIYDDEHMGDYLGVVVHYVNSGSEHHKGGDVTCCAWVQMEGASRHELGDACLAVSGPEGSIQVLSVAEARVTALLRGNGCEVVELRGCSGVPGLLLSLGADGGVALWDTLAGALVAEAASDALAAELHPEGRCLFTGHRGGRICRWDLDWERPAASLSAAATTAAAAAPARLALRGGLRSPTPLALPAGPSPPALGDVVDCIRCLPGERLAAKAADGRLAVWALGALAARGGGGSGGEAGGDGAAEPAAAAAELRLSLRVPGIHASAGGSGGRCRLSAARDGAFLCVGNPAGDVFVYDTLSGARAAHYAAGKAAGAGRAACGAAAALSEDGRHLLAARGHGYILRYEYIRRNAAAGPNGTATAAAVSGAVGGAELPAADGPAPRETDAGACAGTETSREVSPECPPVPEAAPPAPDEAAGSVAGAGAGAGSVAGAGAGGPAAAGGDERTEGGLAGSKRRRPSEEGPGGDGEDGGDGRER